MINGFRSFDKDVNIAGVILNNVSGEHHRTKLLDAVHKYTDTEVIGIVERDTESTIRERHLGLDTISEKGKEDIAPLEGIVSELDLDRILDIAESFGSDDLPSDPPYASHNSGIKVAVPRDDAYCFYYPENLECMKAAGMDVRFFSPLNGDMLPDADVYYLGGGYPELFLDRISENRDFLEGLKTAYEDGRMILGECGGLVTMCNSMTDGRNTVRMSGIFDADASVSGRHGPRYMIADATAQNPFFPGVSMRGHEFHYSDVRINGKYGHGYNLSRGVGLGSSKDGIVSRRSMGSYMHHHALSVKDWLGHVADNAI
jgi:cobyrinic acid a,c-diamide synthase